MTLRALLLVATALFSLGIYGLVTRRQAVALLLSIEVMANAANLVFVAFARYGGAPGHPLVLFALAITVAEVAVGLALVLLFYRRHGDTLLEMASEAKG
ncbi:MAG TPA: NADH-quinone oxidoreductase subunit NuoK [Myxococcaceae bacterium]|nr:NADH-quinone oxidoreductase subunit NuoK [Myxococcaceae bacterium]